MKDCTDANPCKRGVNTTNSQITFLNFDGTCHYQKYLQHIPHNSIDFSSLRGTSLYCSPDAFAVICSSVRKLPVSRLTFLGSGNYHYASLALIQQISKPFTLILFDHHTDLNMGRLGSLLSCGSWVQHAIRETPYLKKVVLIGPDPKTARSVPSNILRRTVIFPESPFPNEQQVLNSIPTADIHISIDKDILSKRFARTNWDQGTLTLKKLRTLLELLMADLRVNGMDVCGEWPIRPHEHFNQRSRQAIHLNEESNLQLTFLYLKKKMKAFQSLPNNLSG